MWRNASPGIQGNTGIWTEGAVMERYFSNWKPVISAWTFVFLVDMNSELAADTKVDSVLNGEDYSTVIQRHPPFIRCAKEWLM